MKIGDEVIWFAEPWHPWPPHRRDQIGVVEAVDDRGWPYRIRFGPDDVRDPSFFPQIIRQYHRTEVNHDGGDEDRT